MTQQSNSSTVPETPKSLTLVPETPKSLTPVPVTPKSLTPVPETPKSLTLRYRCFKYRHHNTVEAEKEKMLYRTGTEIQITLKNVVAKGHFFYFF